MSAISFVIIKASILSNLNIYLGAITVLHILYSLVLMFVLRFLVVLSVNIDLELRPRTKDQDRRVLQIAATVQRLGDGAVFYFHFAKMTREKVILHFFYDILQLVNMNMKHIYDVVWVKVCISISSPV